MGRLAKVVGLRIRSSCAPPRDGPEGPHPAAPAAGACGRCDRLGPASGLWGGAALSEFRTISYDLRDALAVIALNRPDKRNAIDLEMFADLAAAASRAGDRA